MSLKRRLWILILPWAAVLLLGVIVLDRALYTVLYPVFDQRSTLSGMFARSSGIVVGSSQTRWGIDADVLTRQSGIDFQVFAPPGSNIALRRAMIQDYMERFASNPPEVIVLETHPYLFHRRRYPDDAYRTLLGYRPKGLLSEYLADRFGSEPVFLASNVFHCLSFNEEFYATGAGLVDLALLPFKRLRPQAPLPGPREDQMQERIAGWAKFHHSQKLRPMFDFGMQAEFQALMQYLETKPVRVVLLEIPLYRLEPGFNDQFDSVRKRMLALKPARFEYVRLDPERFETNPHLFHDASHFGETGRRLYSEELGRYLAKPLR
jgi:hypothetical protein